MADLKGAHDRFMMAPAGDVSALERFVGAIYENMATQRQIHELTERVTAIEASLTQFFDQLNDHDAAIETLSIARKATQSQMDEIERRLAKLETQSPIAMTCVCCGKATSECGCAISDDRGYASCSIHGYFSIRMSDYEALRHQQTQEDHQQSYSYDCDYAIPSGGACGMPAKRSDPANSTFHLCDKHYLEQQPVPVSTAHDDDAGWQLAKQLYDELYSRHDGIQFPYSETDTDGSLGWTINNAYDALKEHGYFQPEPPDTPQFAFEQEQHVCEYLVPDQKGNYQPYLTCGKPATHKDNLDFWTCDEHYPFPTAHDDAPDPSVSEAYTGFGPHGEPDSVITQGADPSLYEHDRNCDCPACNGEPPEDEDLTQPEPDTYYTAEAILDEQRLERQHTTDNPGHSNYGGE